MIVTFYLAAAIPLFLLLALHPTSELLAMFRRRPSPPAPSANEQPALLVLVPAHDEEKLIRQCVASLLRMDYPKEAFSVVVIADNCNDNTAQVARAAGAHTIERREPELPGKPQALAWALKRLEIANYAACIVIDADTEVDAGLASWMARRESLTDRCVQAYFDISNETESWLTRLAAVLTRIRYERSYPLKRAAELNSPLTGNGMCIGRALLSDGWPAMSLTENWELYARFTAEGVPIDYEQQARLYSQETTTLKQATTQRRRWLAGRAWVLRKYFRPILRSKRITAHQKLDALAELASPSPVLHVVAGFALLLPAPFLLPGPLVGVIAVAILATILPLATHTVSVLHQHPERWRIVGSMLFLPVYAIWRVIMALMTIATLRRGQWKKTERA